MLGSLNPFSQRESHALEILGRRGKERSSTWSSVRRRSSRNCFRYCPKRQLPFCAIPRCPRGCYLPLGIVSRTLLPFSYPIGLPKSSGFPDGLAATWAFSSSGETTRQGRVSDLATACRVEVEEEHLATGEGPYRHCHSS